jgi:hypothetical protein
MKKQSTLPRGAGSVQIRSRHFWAIWTDVDGRRCQENTWTDDPREAKVFVLKRSFRAARERAARLKALLDDAVQDARASRAGGL